MGQNNTTGQQGSQSGQDKNRDQGMKQTPGHDDRNKQGQFEGQKSGDKNHQGQQNQR